MAEQKATSPVAQAEGRGRGRSGKKEVETIRVRKGENGGHVVTHEYKRPPQRGDRYIPSPEPEDFIFGDSEGKQALAHVAKHMGIKNEAASSEGTKPDDDEEDDE